MTEVLVFVPGIMGSELWDKEGKVWPGTLKDGIFGYSDAKFERLCAPDLEPRDIIRKAVGLVEVYQPWIETFERLISNDSSAALFKEGGPKPTLISVPYDWRKPIEGAAEAVASALGQALHDHGPKVSIHLAAHSMGGLVCRFLLQSGQFKQRPGFDKIESFLTFGTPHKGTAIALAGAMGLHKAQFLNASQTARLVNDARYPSLYQLFPQSGTAMVWDARSGKRLAPLDVFQDPAFARLLGLTATSLQAAAQFHASLNLPMPNVRQFLFVGTRFETPTHFHWSGESLTLIRTKDSGDGTVTLQGSMIENQQIRLTDKSHASLIEAEQTRMALQSIFDAVGLLAMVAGTRVTLAVGQLVVEHRSRIEIALNISGVGANIEGTLFLERARPGVDAEEVLKADFDVENREHERALNYDGPELTSMHVFFEDVAGPAIFRPVFETNQVPRQRVVGPAFVVKRPE